MNRLCRKLLSEQQGSTIVLVAFAFTLLLAAAGIVVDGGRYYTLKSHLQKTANAAALSGATELVDDEPSVQAVIQDILSHHGETDSLAGAPDIQLMNSDRVTLKKQLKLGFAGIFGQNTVTASAQAAAQLFPIGSAIGAAPLGIDNSITLNYNTPYQLKVDSGDSSTGYFGVLALGGTGASTYEDNLKYGYQNAISVNDVIDTQTGNISGSTQDGIQLRLDSDPYPIWDYTKPGTSPNRDSPRVLLIPVYEPVSSSQQLKEIKVVGFAYFYILAPMNKQDSSITGVFFKKADIGTAGPGAVDKGAYTIKLVE